jgi:hypothetical protein
MAGKVTIKDSTTTKYVFEIVSQLRHSWTVAAVVSPLPGEEEPAIDHEKTVTHTITVDFELVDQGAYSGGADPGTTGDIWKQRSLLDDLRNQASTNDYYTLIEEDESVETSGWNGVITRIDTTRDRNTHGKMTGTLQFTQSEEVFNL